ncbi:hypothetical protein Pint_02510 [Pistacia integerrima]|uniref:Uncharacterized protein n=1 Tax=Pistacia integerrima TaxID=434235 RepID=A0ACC0ZKU9_9ROSI|nr:hypothetical protein Pint_02510 [Pistacia integerrima]
MAADQRRKRVNGTSVAGCSSLKQYGMKKRKLESQHKGLNSKSHISLEWDGNIKKVVARKDQIGITRRNLRPFIDSVPGSHNALADVFSIPQDIFELENLSEVLSYEVWQTQLSEDERKFLMQFLPSGQNAEHVVQALLSGDNIDFGNPFLKWQLFNFLSIPFLTALCTYRFGVAAALFSLGASLCSGNLHPDAVLHQERCLKADKKAYYSELQKYHDDIIEYLQKLKDNWESCKDPEEEILPKFGRSRRDAEKRISSNASESRLRDLEQDVTATSESCSWVADEKASSSDNQNSSAVKGGEHQKRMHDKGFKKDKSRNPLFASDDVLNVGAKLKKGDKLKKRNIHHSDGAKYMSYFKISKKQHELVKSMKQSGKSIQSKSLNRVLGNLDGLHVQPYEVFEEEEKKKLHKHWLQLANEDLPIFYANWKERKLQMWEITQSLGQEMKDRLKFLVESEEEEIAVAQDEEEENAFVQDEEEENAFVQDEEEENIVVQDEEEENVVVQDEEEEIPFVQDEEEENPVVQDAEEENPVVQDEMEEYRDACHDQKEDVAAKHESNTEDDEDSGPGSPQDQYPQRVSSPSRNPEFNHIDMDLENNHVTSKSDNSSSDVSGPLEKMNTADDNVNDEDPLPSGGNVWHAMSRPRSYYDSTATHEFPIGGLPLMNPRVNEDQQSHLIDLESDLKGDMRKDLLHRQSDDGSLNSYQTHDRNELLQSLFKAQGMLSYHQEQKQAGLDFQPPNNLLMAADGRFPGHFQEQLQTSLQLEQGPKRLNDIFMQQNISEHIYPDRGRYLIPRQENLQPGNMQNWTINPARMSEPMQSHINSGELLNQNWFSGEHQVRGGWTGSDGSSFQSQSIGNGNNADQSLYSVLTNCGQLCSVNPYESIGSTEQFISSRNYGLMAGGAPGISNALPHTAHPLDYLGGRDAPTSVMPDDMGWMNLPHQNPTLHDQMGKPYLRSWNQ